MIVNHLRLHDDCEKVKAGTAFLLQLAGLLCGEASILVHDPFRITSITLSGRLMSSRKVTWVGHKELGSNLVVTLEG